MPKHDQTPRTQAPPLPTPTPALRPPPEQRPLDPYRGIGGSYVRDPTTGIRKVLTTPRA